VDSGSHHRGAQREGVGSIQAAIIRRQQFSTTPKKRPRGGIHRHEVSSPNQPSLLLHARKESDRHQCQKAQADQDQGEAEHR
jgi:hypothetical protein